MPTRALRIVLVVLALLPVTLAAQTVPRLFELQAGRAPDGPEIEAAWRVAIDHEIVMAAPRLRLEMPDVINSPKSAAGSA